MLEWRIHCSYSVGVVHLRNCKITKKRSINYFSLHFICRIVISSLLRVSRQLLLRLMCTLPSSPKTIEDLENCKPLRQTIQQRINIAETPAAQQMKMRT